MKIKNILLSLVLLSFGLFLGLGAQSQPPKTELKAEQAPFIQQGSGMEDAIINVAKTSGQAVVSISTEHLTKFKGGKKFYFSTPFGGQDSPFGENDSLNRFFGDFFGQLPDREFKQKGLGSGVIIDPKGYILTNEHVINDADKITVTLPDGRELKGEVKGRDMRSDLAVIKIDARDLPFASLGDSDDLKIGQWVVAIGNPFGFALQNPEPTVTVGVVSALHRTLGRGISADRDYNDLIQTDAAINPGNSGGPLVNLKGQIVGINVAIFSTSGGYQGVGFAIPVNNAKRIITRLIEGKKIVYGWLGVTVQDLTLDLAKYFGLSEKNGVLVAKVLENGPAQKGGIKEGDIIQQLDNEPIPNVKELLSVVGKAEAGRKVKVKVLREKKEVTLEVQIGSRPENLEGTEEEGAESSSENWRGIDAQDLESQSGKRFKFQEKNGVVIVSVEGGSPADEAGLVPGDVILEMNKHPIKNMEDYKKVTSGLKEDALVRTGRGYFLVKPE